MDPLRAARADARARPRAHTESVCVLDGEGPALHYRVHLPAGATLSVDASPATAWDPVVALSDACGANACRAASNRSPKGWPERLVYTNPGAAGHDLIIAVSSAEASVDGPFDLRIAITP